MNKKGFTLIELLIVVVIIGILAAIALPRFGETRDRAFRSSVESDLRNLQTAQEQYYFDNSYNYSTDDIAEGATSAALGFTASEGVSITISSTDTGSEYTAVGTHSASAGNGCTLTVSVAAGSSVECYGDWGDGTAPGG